MSFVKKKKGVLNKEDLFYIKALYLKVTALMYIGLCKGNKKGFL